jgi:hypothetical protein
VFDERDDLFANRRVSCECALAHRRRFLIAHCEPSSATVPLVSNGVDALITAAGKTYVMPGFEDPSLLERLRDPHVLERAEELLTAADEDTRHRAILCIGRIGYVLDDQDTAELLLRHAAAHTRKASEALVALDALQALHPPRELPAEPLVRLARRPEWSAWHAAVRCLHLTDAGAAEMVLLERVAAIDTMGPTDRLGMIDVAFELRFLTTPTSLQALESLLSQPSEELPCVALDSLGERLGAQVLPHARTLAGHRLSTHKWRAQKWLARYGDVDDVPFMAKRLRQLGTGSRSGSLPPEVSFLVPFLLAHEEEPAARRALDRIRSSSERLPEQERAWIAEHVPHLLEPR